MQESQENEKRFISQSLSKEISNERQAKKPYKARRIGKRELARLYNLTLDGFRKKLMAETGLIEELEAIGYKRSQQEFTKKQVEIIIRYLDDPYQY